MSDISGIEPSDDLSALVDAMRVMDLSMSGKSHLSTDEEMIAVRDASNSMTKAILPAA